MGYDIIGILYLIEYIISKGTIYLMRYFMLCLYLICVMNKKMKCIFQFFDICLK